MPGRRRSLTTFAGALLTLVYVLAAVVLLWNFPTANVFRAYAVMAMAVMMFGLSEHAAQLEREQRGEGAAQAARWIFRALSAAGLIAGFVAFVLAGNQ